MKLGYARVSTDDQDTRLQLDALKREGCKRILEEKVSGSKADRPELQRLLDTARKGDVVIVWKLDRLGRSLKDLIEIVTRLEEAGIGFRSLTEAIDTTSSTGRMVFHIFGALAQFERDLIRDRTRAGLAAARARGRKGGRRPKLSPEQVEKARTLAAARNADGSYRHTKGSIARELGVSPMTLWRALTRSPAATRKQTPPRRARSRKRSRSAPAL